MLWEQSRERNNSGAEGGFKKEVTCEVGLERVSRVSAGELQGGEKGISCRGRDKSTAGEDMGCLGNSGEHACVESALGEVQWDIGLAENRSNYTILLKVFYRVRVFPFPPGKLHYSPYTPAE